MARNPIPIHQRFYYLGLFSSMPANDRPDGVELRGSGYRRRPIAFGARCDGYRRNIAPVRFGPTFEAWAPVVGFGLYERFEGGRRIDSFGVEGGVFFMEGGSSFEVEAGEVVCSEMMGDDLVDVVEIDGGAKRLDSCIVRSSWSSAPDFAWTDVELDEVCGIVLGRRTINGQEHVVALGERGDIYAAVRNVLSVVDPISVLGRSVSAWGASVPF